MNKVINFHQERNPGRDESIFNSIFTKPDGTFVRFDFLKDNETGEIVLGITNNFDKDIEDMLVIPEENILHLCYDEDGFIQNKIEDAIRDTI